jgi:hypothetical protein
MGRELWPPQSHNLNPYDFYLLGILKEKTYLKNRQTLEELSENIRHEISAVPI